MLSLNVTNFEEWRSSSRYLLNSHIPPEEVHWSAEQQSSLFDVINEATKEDLSTLLTTAAPTTKIRIPKSLLSQFNQAAYFIPPDKAASTSTHHLLSNKWALFYSLLWRYVNVNKHVFKLKSDPQVHTFQSMLRSVSRDNHKMHAFVRFSEIKNAQTHDTDTSDSYFVSWFEPQHAIIEMAAPFFMRRFTGMTWSILTPHGCAHWDQTQLTYSEGVCKPIIPADEFDNFWRIYYQNIFNPARLKLSAMQNEMPKKYWRNLPEAQCIKELSRDSAAQMQIMLKRPNTSAERVREYSTTVREYQDELRAKQRI